MSEGSGQPQRYCRNCGAEVRSGTSFCVSCGTPVDGGPASPGPDHSSSPPPTPPQRSLADTLTPPQRSFADTLRGTFSGLTRLFPNVRSSSGRATLSGLTSRGINWFRDLPSVPKLVLVGLLLLLLLTVLSPVARVVAIIVFVVSAVVLTVRAIQRKPLRGWVVAVVGSLLLIPVFDGVSGAIYGSDSGSGEAGESESLYDASSSPETPGTQNGGSETEAPSADAPSSPYDIAPSTSSMPYYRVVSASAAMGQCILRVQMETEFDLYREDTELVFNDIGAQTVGKCGYVDLTVENYNDVEVPQGFADRILRPAGSQTLAQGIISHDSYGETMTDVPQGTYAIDFWF